VRGGTPRWRRGRPAAARLRAGPRFAGRRHRRAARGGFRRRLSRWLLAGQEVLDLLAGERFVFDQALRQELEVGSTLGHDLPRELIAILDEALDFGVDLAGRVFGHVLLAGHRIAEENLFLVLALGHGTELLREA